MREIPAPLLSERTTLHLGGRAISELVPENHDDFYRLQERAKSLGGELVYIGRGSNLLALDGELPIVLVRVNGGKKIEIIESEDDDSIAHRVLVKAGADVPLPKLLNFCLKNGLSGLEGLAGIPGTVGGAVAMNAGSFGVEIGQLIRSVEVYAHGEIKSFYSTQLEKKYRKIVFTGLNARPIILTSTFILTPAPKGVIFSRMHLNFFEKKSKQPVTAWSAGCAFKNPANAPAGKLLEMAGFKGKELGGMFFSPMHANFLINGGCGSATAALELLGDARQTVLQRFGINLELEIEVVPWHLP